MILPAESVVKLKAVCIVCYQDAERDSGQKRRRVHD